jgi:hypothetical protein
MFHKLGDVRQMAVTLVVVKTVAHDEDVRNVGADVFYVDVALPRRLFSEQGAYLQAPRGAQF